MTVLLVLLAILATGVLLIVWALWAEDRLVPAVVDPLEAGYAAERDPQSGDLP